MEIIEDESDEKVEEYSTFGRHVAAELWGVENIPNDIKDKVKKASISCGATVLSIDEKQYNGKQSVLCLLSESHVSLHTNMMGYVTLDAYTCGGTIDPEDIVNKLIDLLAPKKIHRKKMIRGKGEIETIY